MLENVDFGKAVLTNSHNLCFKQKYEKYLSILSENFQFLEVKFSMYLNRGVFVTVSDKIQHANNADPYQTDKCIHGLPFH